MCNTATIMKFFLVYSVRDFGMNTYHYRNQSQMPEKIFCFLFFSLS